MPTDRRPRRCAYCGHACHGYSCHYHRDLAWAVFGVPPLDPLRDPVLRCRMMDSPEADLPRMSDELRDAVQATKGTGG